MASGNSFRGKSWKRRRMEPAATEMAPRELSIMEYAEAHAKELLDMASAARTVKKNNPTQRLPRHMRRRAASHNVKRLPRNMRREAEREVSRASQPTKRPSRRHRRRPGNLLEEYARRQRQYVWLETHIWHAKRFHMMENWGYKIPVHHNDRGVRASHRAAAKYCLLQDLSYYCCIELAGLEQCIIRGLGQLSSPETAGFPGTKSCIEGGTEGCCVLYRRGLYPEGALGEVRLLWRPPAMTSAKNPDVALDERRQQCGCHGDACEARRRLWIWSHPACYSEILEELKAVFDAQETPREGAVGQEGEPLLSVSLAVGSPSPAVDHNEVSSTPGVAQDAVDSSSKITGVKVDRDVEKDTVQDDSACTQKMQSDESTAVQSTAVDPNPGKNVAAVDPCKSKASRGGGSSIKHGKGSNRSGKSKGKRTSRQDGASSSAVGAKVPTTLVNTCFHGAEVCVMSLKDTLCRFRLSGPLSHAVLRETLTPAEVADSPAATSDGRVGAEGDACQDARWWQRYYRSETPAGEDGVEAGSDSGGDVNGLKAEGEGGMYKVHQDQSDLWRRLAGLETPALMPSGCVLGLTIRDPRLFLPRKKTMAVNKTKSEVSPPQCLPSTANWSALWENWVRSEVKETKMTEHKLNERRANNLVPGSVLDLGTEESRVPALLLQQPGGGPRGEHSACGLGYGAGWDLVLPGGWGMAFWVPLVYRGARTAGLQDLTRLALERGSLAYPSGYPDTPAGRQSELDEWRQRYGKYQRMPPAKRPCYGKLGVAAPLWYPWAELTVEWSRRGAGVGACTDRLVAAAPPREQDKPEGGSAGSKPTDRPAPHSAGMETGAVAGMVPGAVAGIETGAVAGMVPGAVAGMETGAVAGMVPGAVAGIETGAVAGMVPGAVAGMETGAVAGMVPGAVAGMVPGAVAGMKTGAVAGTFHVLRCASMLHKLDALCTRRRKPTLQRSGKHRAVEDEAGVDPQPIAKAARTTLTQTSVHDTKPPTAAAIQAATPPAATPQAVTPQAATASAITIALSDLRTSTASHSRCLVPVQVTVVSRGSPVAYTSIHAPTPADLATLAGDGRHAGPLEPMHKPPKAPKDPKGDKTPKGDKKKKKKSPGACVDVSLQPPSVENLLESSSRTILGFVKDGGFSLANGKGFGVGFVTLQGLLEVLEAQAVGNSGPGPRHVLGPIVLLKTSNSYQYRYAYLTVIPS